MTGKLKIFAISLIFTIFACCLAREPSLYYTLDGKKIERIEGADLNSRFEFQKQRKEGWMVMGAARFSCNGYIPQEGFISFGGKKTTFVIKDQPFLGFSMGEQSEDRKIYFDEIQYIIPPEKYDSPMRAVLVSGEKGYLFISNRPLYARQSKKDTTAEESGVYVIRLKPKRTGVQGELKKEILKCKCISFSRQGVQEAIRNNFKF